MPLSGKKVLFVVTEDWFFWMHRRNLALFLKEKGAEIYVASRKGTYFNSILNDGFHFTEFEISRKSLNPFLRLRNIFHLKKILNQVSPDILHCVSIQPILIGAFASIGKKHLTVLAFTGLGYLFSENDLKRKTVRSLILSMLRYLFRLIHPVCIFENSDDENEIRLKTGGTADSYSTVPGSGVDLKLYSFVPEKPGGKRVLFSGRLLKEKGAELYAEAAAVLKKKNPEYEFLMAGPLDSENRGAVSEKELKKWTLSGNVEWLGNVTDVAGLLKSINIVCLPTYYREGIPMALIEASASGRSAVTTDTPGCREIIKDGVNGILIRPKDLGSLVSALEFLLENPEIRAEHGRKGREIAEKFFSKETINSRVLSIYLDNMRSRYDKTDHSKN
ncbi:MAG TPA: glycosyltransferase family 4 protein [Leptospiraceae bacterium]|nr:glycosyltransferase family 4 protein [Leptospiraceae bacterium]HMY66865.1 glycosyltransferase family 4 protein [Leptospiraceae bacterium]HNF24234.1 glycosyltransferase family 4 protein [Leptospiraceae bacterium]HNI97150.1 glycosyltransferase family 4 protein [Leptospiraceae bacterium]HNN02348.1 glycosyltransferase family 4 protein [Leptospiraceae bacterium]